MKVKKAMIPCRQFCLHQTCWYPYSSVIGAVERNIIFEEINPTHAPDEKDKLELTLIKNYSRLFYPRKESVAFHVKSNIILSCYYLHKSKDEVAIKETWQNHKLITFCTNFGLWKKFWIRQELMKEIIGQGLLIGTLRVFKSREKRVQRIHTNTNNAFLDEEIFSY